MKPENEAPARVNVVGEKIFHNVELPDCSEMSDNEFNAAWSAAGGGRGLMADFLRGRK